MMILTPGSTTYVLLHPLIFNSAVAHASSVQLEDQTYGADKRLGTIITPHKSCVDSDKSAS
jgi:hypothetical protein